MSVLRHYFYIINLSLLLSFLVCYVMLRFSSNNYVPKKNSKQSVLDIDTDLNFSTISHSSLPISQIFGKRDIFGLYSAAGETNQAKGQVSADVPSLVIPEIPAFSQNKAVDFIDPLPISLNGTVISANNQLSVCIIGDETDKQGVYRVGDKFKDATLIKILKDRVVFLRQNGQIETFFLYNNPEAETTFDPATVVSKIDENNYAIDLDKFSSFIKNFGVFLDYFDCTPFIDDQTKKLIGFVVLEKNPASLPAALGFKYLDLILAIDGKRFGNHKERQLLLEKTIADAKPDNTMVVKVERDGTRIELVYKFVRKTDANSLPERIEKYELVSKTKQDEKGLAALLISNKTDSFADNIAKALVGGQSQADEYQANLERIKKEMSERTTANRVK